ncbi:MAG: lipopolysaccharide biosynthesis protein [Steroidobacteraceae bacterium]
MASERLSGLGNRAVILTLARLANYGLTIISPIILVRLLTVAQFGRYREFLLYATVLNTFATFSINASLLYFIPAEPSCRWRIVRQTATLLACSSILVVAALVVIDRASGGRLVGDLLLPLGAFTLFATNLDFWDYYWVATERAGLVFAYSSIRLAARVAVATVTAAVTHNVQTIIWALVGLEGVRLSLAALLWMLIETSATEPLLTDPWRAQLRFCVPSGTGSVLSMLSRNLGGLVVAKMLGAVSFAQYAIGRAGDPVIHTLRTSVSNVVLPEMVRRARGSREASLALWRRATVVNAIVLLPVVVLILRFARPVIAIVFGKSYVAAAIVLKIYTLVIVRECFDFSPAVRALTWTRPLVESNVLSLLTCAILLALLVPVAGVAGAMAAVALSTLVDAGWLAYRTMGAYHLTLGELVPWSNMGKTAVAAILAAPTLFVFAWRDLLGFGGVALGSVAYLVTFALLVLALRVPEAQTLLEWLRRFVPLRTPTSPGA